MNPESQHDVIIVGGGPAGLSAAIYASRAGLSTLVLEQGMPGGQIATSDMVDNYPGIPSISGSELGNRMQEHAVEAGAVYEYGMVSALAREDDGSFAVKTDQGSYRARSVILACGAKPKTVDFEGEGAFTGRGISYCATCDGMFFRNKRVFVVGGGNSACEEAMYLANIASDVEMVIRRDAFRASRGIVDRLLAHDNVQVRYQTSIKRVEGERFPHTITFVDTASGAEHVETYDEGSFGIFVFAGHDPMIDLATPFVDLASDGGVQTDAFMATRTPGLYCAGDMRSTSLRQVVTAAADGALAATGAYRYVERLDSHA